MSNVSFRSIIRLWPTPDEMAAEIGVGVAAARKWLQRDRIPDNWWSAVLSAPRVKNANVTAEMLVTLASRESERATS